jgi:hypothetical protein
MFNIPSFIGAKQPAISSGPVYSTEYQAYLDELTNIGAALPSDSVKTIFNDMVVGLIADGIWGGSKITNLSLAAQDGDINAVKVNMINPTGTKNTINNPETGVTFQPNQGITGDPANLGYIDTNVVPGTAPYTLNSANLFTFIRIQGAIGINASCLNAGNASPGPWIRFDSPNRVYMHSTGFMNVVAPSVGLIKQLFSFNRSGSAATEAYTSSINPTPPPPGTTVTVNDTDGSTGMNTDTFRVLRTGSTAVYSNSQISLFGWGGSLTSTEQAALRNRFITALTSLPGF